MAISKVGQNDCPMEFTAHNAGLILLYPYLDKLFSNAGLFNECRFKGINETAKAIQMLYYIATGIRIAGNEELLIPMILTSGRTDIDFPVNIVMSETIYSECDFLMKVFSDQWPALKSVSADGLREAFLSRTALIEMKEDGWCFTFTGMGIDILLQSLPFSISMIKLNWLETPIFVSW